MCKISSVMIVIILVVVVTLSGLSLSSVKAQTSTPDDDTCYSCHDNLYALYDTGRWYCLCEAPMHCTYCHGGVVGTLDEEAAHAGMVVRPNGNEAAICMDCHENDTEQKLAMFASHSSLASTYIPESPYTITLNIVTDLPGESLNTPFLQSWQIITLSLLGIGVIILVLFGIKCYREDCIRKRINNV